MDPVRRIVVLDFDGTVAVGDEPLLAYARAVGAERELTRWLEKGRGHRDGYALVAAAAARLGVPEEDRAAAYAASRAALHDGALAVEAPAGLADLLARRPADVRAVLVTNAPSAGMERVLSRLRIVLDEVVGEAGKPSGMPAILRRLLAEAHLPPDALLSVGDVWENDLRPAAALGAVTALVDRWGLGEGTPTRRARTLTELLPAIERWWR